MKAELLDLGTLTYRQARERANQLGGAEAFGWEPKVEALTERVRWLTSEIEGYDRRRSEVIFVGSHDNRDEPQPAYLVRVAEGPGVEQR